MEHEPPRLLPQEGEGPHRRGVRVHVREGGDGGDQREDSDGDDGQYRELRQLYGQHGLPGGASQRHEPATIQEISMKDQCY